MDRSVRAWPGPRAAIGAPPVKSPPSGSGFGAGRDAFVTTLYREFSAAHPRLMGCDSDPGCSRTACAPVVAVAIWDSAEHRRGVWLRLAPHFPLAAAYAFAVTATAETMMHSQ
jgi:hypothetical protein